MARNEPQRLIVVLDRPAVFAEIVIGKPAVIVGIGMVWIEPQRLVAILDCTTGFGGEAILFCV